MKPSLLLIAILAAGALVASADTIRIRVTHEGTGFTNVTTVAITGTNRVEQIKEWIAERTTNTVDAALANDTAAEIRAQAAERKRERVRAALISAAAAQAAAAVATVQE